MQKDLQYIKEDLNVVEKHRIELYRARDRFSPKLRIRSDDDMGTSSRDSTIDRKIPGLVCNSHDSLSGITSEKLQYKKDEVKAQVNPIGTQGKDPSFSVPMGQHTNESGLAVTRKKRIHAQVRQV